MPDNETIDPATGEILTAADGTQRHPAARSLADFMRMIEEGQFDADVAFDLNELAADLENMAITMGDRKLTAVLAMKISIVREPGGLYKFLAEHSIKKPKEVRRASVGWLTEDNFFTPNKPNQGNLFGTVRDVTPSRVVRDAR